MSCSSTQHGAPNEDRVSSHFQAYKRLRSVARLKKQHPALKHVNKELLDSLYRPLQCFKLEVIIIIIKTNKQELVLVRFRLNFDKFRRTSMNFRRYVVVSQTS